jgi:hypothetical protein
MASRTASLVAVLAVHLILYDLNKGGLDQTIGQMGKKFAAILLNPLDA